jgi:hypothetical protein
MLDETVLTASTAALIAGLRLIRARTPGTPPGDQDDEHEDNTFSLPNGNPIRRKMKDFARRQLKRLLGTLPEIGAPLPDRFPPLADWTNPMASAMTPLIAAYWDEAGKTTRARLGLDPDVWEVHDPHLHEMIRKATFSFCNETNATTNLRLEDALEQLRQQFLEGLVDRGDTIPQLAARVKSVFKDLATWRAEMIGRTEASRAIHAASIESAKESGVVQGKKWLTSANSCDKCVAKAAEYNGTHGVPLDQTFGETGSKNAVYAQCPGPPLHPHCRCSLTFVLADEYEALLKQYPPGSDFQPGSLGPEPKAREVAKSPAAPVAPAAKEPTVFTDHEFGPSAKVKAMFAGDSAKAAERIFGRKISGPEIASACGAPDGSKVKMRLDSDGNLFVDVEHKTIEIMQRIFRRENGKVIVHNEIFKLLPEYQDTPEKLGLRAFGRQVENAQKAGVSHIETNAFRVKGATYLDKDGKEKEKWIGYYVWPSYGYDGPLRSSTRDALMADPDLPMRLKVAKNVSQLMAEPEGVKWWRKNGVPIDVEFDLKPGSYSLDKLDKYLQERLK